MKEFRKENRLPSCNTAKKYLHMEIKEYLKEHYPEMYSKDSFYTKDASQYGFWDREKILDALDAFVKNKKRLPRVSEYSRKNNLPYYRTVLRYIGDLNVLYKTRYPQYVRQRENNLVRNSAESIAKK